MTTVTQRPHKTGALYRPVLATLSANHCFLQTSPTVSAFLPQPARHNYGTLRPSIHHFSSLSLSKVAMHYLNLVCLSVCLSEQKCITAASVQLQRGCSSNMTVRANRRVREEWQQEENGKDNRANKNRITTVRGRQYQENL